MLFSCNSYLRDFVSHRPKLSRLRAGETTFKEKASSQAQPISKKGSVHFSAHRENTAEGISNELI